MGANASASQVDSAHGGGRSSPPAGPTQSQSASSSAQSPGSQALSSTKSSPQQSPKLNGSESSPGEPKVVDRGLSWYLLETWRRKTRNQERYSPAPELPKGYTCLELPSKVRVWRHESSGIEVWETPVNLCDSVEDEPIVLYRYTERVRFRELTHCLTEEVVLVTAMESSQTGEFGQGSYLCWSEPAAAQSKDALVLNKFWPNPYDREPPEDRLLDGPDSPANRDVCEEILADKQMSRRADYGIAVIAPRRSVYNIWQRPAPGLPIPKDEWEPGMNTYGEVVWRGRDIWVLNLEKEDQIQLGLKCQHLLSTGHRLKDKTLACFDNLAILLEESALDGSRPMPERLEFAESLHREVLSARNQALGRRHPETALSMNNLAVLLCRLGKHSEAETLAKAAEHALKEFSGPRLWECQSNLAAIKERSARQSSLHNLQRAVEGHARVLEMRLSEELSNQPNNTSYTPWVDKDDGIKQSMSNLMLALETAGNLSRLQELVDRFDLKETLSHAEAGSGFGCGDSVARLKWRIGKADEALTAYCTILFGHEAGDMRGPTAGRVAQLGGKSTDTLGALENLAAVLREEGRLDEAEALLQRALFGYCEVLGKHHPAAKQCLANLALVYMARDDFETAGGLFSGALEDRVCLVMRVGAVLEGRGVTWQPDVAALNEQVASAVARKLRQLMGEEGEDLTVEADSFPEGLLPNMGFSSTELEEQQASLKQQKKQILWRSLEVLVHLPFRPDRRNMMQQLEECLRDCKSAICNEAAEQVSIGNTGPAQNFKCKLVSTRPSPSLASTLNSNKGDPGGINYLHPDVLTVVSNFAVLLRKSRRYNEAESLSDFARQSRRLWWEQGMCTIEYLETLNNHALIMHDKGETEKAIEICREAYDKAQDAFGGDHFVVLQSRFNLAIMLEIKGTSEMSAAILSEAWDHQCSVLAKRMELLGAMHPLTTSSYQHMRVLDHKLPGGMMEDTNATGPSAQNSRALAKAATNIASGATSGIAGVAQSAKSGVANGGIANVATRLRRGSDGGQAGEGDSPRSPRSPRLQGGGSQNFARGERVTIADRQPSSRGSSVSPSGASRSPDGAAESNGADDEHAGARVESQDKVSEFTRLQQEYKAAKESQKSSRINLFMTSDGMSREDTEGCSGEGLYCLLSVSGATPSFRKAMVVDDVSGEVQRWETSFDLPADVGSEAEQLDLVVYASASMSNGETDDLVGRRSLREEQVRLLRAEGIATEMRGDGGAGGVSFDLELQSARGDRVVALKAKLETMRFEEEQPATAITAAESSSHDLNNVLTLRTLQQRAAAQERAGSNTSPRVPPSGGGVLGWLFNSRPLQEEACVVVETRSVRSVMSSSPRELAGAQQPKSKSSSPKDLD